MHRPTVGIIAIALLVAGACIWIWRRESDDWIPWMAGCLRMSVVMGAVWLAHPQLNRLPAWLVACVLASAVVLALRPKYFLLALVVLAIAAFLRPRRRAGRRQDTN